MIRRRSSLVRVATVLSAQPWEAELVALARSNASVRVVTRAYEPDDVERANPDVVVVGAETAWLTPARMLAWKAAGYRIVGLYPLPDRPAAERLEIGGVDEILSNDTPAPVVLRTIRAVAAVPGEARPSGRTVAVVGPPGSPGVTETAISIAWGLAALAPTLVMEVHPATPTLAIRLRTPPRPNIQDSLDAVAATGRMPRSLPTTERPSVLPGAHQSRPGAWPAAADLLEAARLAYDWVVIDAGAVSADDPLLGYVNQAVLVVDAASRGLVRAARYVTSWTGVMPALIVNRVPPNAKTAVRDDILRAARLCTGLEPSLLIEDDPHIAAASRLGDPPHDELVRQLGRMHLPEPERHVVPSKW